MCGAFMCRARNDTSQRRRRHYRTRPAGIIVINTVLIDNIATAAHTLEDLGFELDMVQIQVSRATPMPFSHRLEAANPVWIITGSRP